MEEGFQDSDRTRNCMMVILILLVAITILFEFCCHWRVSPLPAARVHSALLPSYLTDLAAAG